MKYNRFEELPVWQAGIDLAAEIYLLTRQAGVQESLQPARPDRTRRRLRLRLEQHLPKASNAAPIKNC